MKTKVCATILLGLMLTLYSAKDNVVSYHTIPSLRLGRSKGFVEYIKHNNIIMYIYHKSNGRKLIALKEDKKYESWLYVPDAQGNTTSVKLQKPLFSLLKKMYQAQPD